MKKRITALTLAFITLFSFPAFGHSGRTDGSGGHKDNKNKSGLGSYHYHCGGNPAHLHSGGVCPYSSSAKKQSTTTTTKSTTTTSSSTAKQVTVDNSLKAQVPNFAVLINGVDINTSSAEYPPLLFNDITYIPFTADIINYLNLEYIWNKPTNLIINRSADAAKSNSFALQFQNGKSTKGMKCTITKVDKGIVINDVSVNSQYPVINYNNINYLPLTYEVITNLGFTNKWDPAIGFELNLK